jgi:hypothetical protein
LRSLAQHYADIGNLEARVLSLLEAYFIAAGATTVHRHNGPLDLQVVRSSAATCWVELKLYRTADSKPFLKRALDQVARAVKGAPGDNGILIVTLSLDSEERAKLSIPSDIDLWDIEDLVGRLAPFNALHTGLLDILSDLRGGLSETNPAYRTYSSLIEMLTQKRSTTQGEQLACKLESIPAGRENGAPREFEAACTTAMQDLFGSDLTSWTPQRRSADGLHRPDLMARITSANPFWSALSSDFRSRYVVFEFKNYVDEITQVEVYSTEKYLFTPAVRSVAFLIARNGADDNAKAAMSGAPREQGKVILCFDLAEICSMLRGLDAGEEPTTGLLEKLDGLLMRLGR